MDHYGQYRRRRRRVRRGSMLLMLLLSALFLVSCVAGSNMLWVRGVLGLDLTEYRAEAVTEEPATESAICAELCATVDLLVMDRLELTPFTKGSEAVAAYREEILNHLLQERYSIYTGNAEALARVEESYPRMTLSTVIPETDLEEVFSRYFGVQSVHHTSGELFTYLKRSGHYSPSVKSWEKSVTVVPQSLVETAHTYRLTFCLTDGEATSQSYEALFVKRDDGSCYLRSLTV
ncbi:MAG: hypothetical protein IJX28_08160 [Clostridia bacterium]|nr:hypothetical protein [Clostridia bacterium]